MSGEVWMGLRPLHTYDTLHLLVCVSVCMCCVHVCVCCVCVVYVLCGR